MVTAPATDRQVIRCDECRTPVAEVREQGVLIKSRHQGTFHATLITWAQLRELLERAGKAKAA